jgi:hypothetical protein
MTDPVTAMTASAIASLAFQEFVKSGAGDLAKRFTGEAIAKMGQLRDLIWNKLKGNPDAEEALQNVQAGLEEEVSDVATYLKSAMKNDQDFAAQVQAIAKEIHAGKLQDNSSMVQNNSENARGWQTKVEGGTAYIGDIKQYGIDFKPNEK